EIGRRGAAKRWGKKAKVAGFALLALVLWCPKVWAQKPERSRLPKFRVSPGDKVQEGTFRGLQEQWHTERGFLETRDQHCVDRWYTIEDDEHVYVAGQSTCHPNWDAKLKLWPNTPVRFILYTYDGKQLIGIVRKNNRIDWFGLSDVLKR